MPDFATMQYQAIAQQIKRCLEAMTDAQIERGLTAFEDGASNWSNCFWARVFEGGIAMVPQWYKAKNGKTYKRELVKDDTAMFPGIEWWIADRLGLESNIPVRIVYNLFDGFGSQMKRADLRDFIRKARIEGDTPDAVMDLIRSVPLTTFTVEPSWNAEVSCDLPRSV